MRYRQEFWSKWWSPSPEHLNLLNDALHELRAAAQLALLEMPTFSLKDVLQAATCFPRATAVGVDQWSPRDFLRLLSQAVQSLAAVFSECEQSMYFPQQCYVTVMALLPKSVTEERAISKCSTLYRMYARTRGDYL